MKFFKKAMISVLILMVILAGLGAKTFYDAGEFKAIKPHFDGEVKIIAGVLSSEDITIHPPTAMAFISSDDRRAHWAGNSQTRQGAIYGFDLNSANPRLVNLTADFSKELNPHGIGWWMAENGDLSIFVVNHPRGGHLVEIFDYRGGKLVHRRSVSGELMHSPNDVLPVGPDSFYVSNDHGNSTGFGRMAEEYLQLARSYVLYYDGKNFRKVAEGLAYANGINMSSDGQTVYVAATVGQKIYVYDRDGKTGDLSLRSTIEAETGVDNIEIDQKGDLWVGSHPKLLTFVKYSKDTGVLSPSQVIKVEKKAAGQYNVREIYLNNGQQMSGSSVAAVFEDTLLIGSVFDERFLLCNLQN
ncbi:MAG: SMP-30/gluconolactonase/LRE family protein [Desulfobacterales bacterium]